MIEPLHRRVIPFSQRAARPLLEFDLFAVARIFLVALVWAENAKYFHFFQEVQALNFAHFVESSIFWLLSTALLVGWQARKVSFCFGLFFLWLRDYNGKILNVEHFQSHHFSLLALTFIFLTTIADKKSEWYLTIFRGLLSSVYFYAAVSKMALGYLTGTRLYFLFSGFFFDSVSTPLNLDPWCAIVAWSVLAMELVLTVAVWRRKWAMRAFPFAMIFHALMYLAFPVGTFSLLMALLWLIILEPRDRRLLVH